MVDTITAKELRKIIPSGTKQLCDKSWLLPTDDDVKHRVNVFIRYRAMLDKIKDTLIVGAVNPGEVEGLPDFIGKQFEYVDNYHDCDNCALELVAFMSGTGWPFGMGFIKGHCLCVYVNDKKELKYVEPLDGAWVDQPVELKLTFMV